MYSIIFIAYCQKIVEYMKKFLVLFFVMLSLVSCGFNRIEKDKVVARIDNLKSRPKWIKESTPFYVKDGEMYMIGQTKLPAKDANISMGYRIAENNAKMAFSSMIEQRLSYIFQNAEEGLDVNASQVKYVAGETSKITVNSLMLSDRYWEQVVSTVDAEGRKQMYYIIFARVRISEDEFKKTINNTLEKNKNKELSEKFKQQVDNHWDDLIGPEISNKK